MGIMCAAIATGISQTVSRLIVAVHFIMRRGDLKICKYKPQMAMFGQVVFFGLPEMIAQFATPVTTICLNNVIVANLGDMGVNAFAIISYVASLALSVFVGTSEGLLDSRACYNQSTRFRVNKITPKGKHFACSNPKIPTFRA